ncbi:MAG: anthranilate phosphoribosyltransferase [Fimbriimonadaceae bacterium]|nr:anthranilate phosphoribosyltransferase [Fimbriimonadaceae bacterium]
MLSAILPWYFMDFPSALHQIGERRDLSRDNARELMAWVMDGFATEAQIGGLLIALRMKGVNAAELAGFAEAMRARASRIESRFDKLVDTCGTGGGKPTFNVSTGAAILAAAVGAKVAKHGNRAVTGVCGSADVLEALGVRLTDDPEKLSALLNRVGFVFLFAPSHHPAMRHVGKARRELGVRTVFNQLGPLANPAGATRQLIGVYDPALLRPTAEALLLLGVERAMVVHGEDGIDEISPVAPTRVMEIREGRLTERVLKPEDFGVRATEPNDLLPGTDAESNAEILKEALYNVESPRCAAIIPSAAAAIWLGGEAANLQEAAVKARNAVRNGFAMTKLEALRFATADL